MLGFAIFWTVMAASASSGGPMGVVFPLFGIPFILTGIFMVFILPMRNIRNRNSSIYAITDKRVYILYDNARPTLKSFEFYRLTNVTVDLLDGEIGNVRFQTGQTYTTTGRHGRYGAATPIYDGFYNIRNAQYVFRILNEQTEVKL